MPTRPLQTTAIALLCIGAAIVYGILHDLITAHICVEYFSIGHPHVIDSESPTALALVWGVLATWWVGLIFGLPLGLAAQFGSSPPVGPREVARLVSRLLLIMASCAALAGFVGYILARQDQIHLIADLAERVPQSRHTAFLAVGAAHLASYATGFLGGVILIFVVISRRKRLRRAS